MCGIAGFIASDNKTEKLISSLNIMYNRGPNGTKHIIYDVNNLYVGFGHVRLSVIDLTDQAAQPFESTCGKYSLIFNGEIYNYIEIRKELEEIGFTFQTNSDTEVLLYAWQHYGLNILPKIIGMFSFAILDKKSNKVTLVRDAFGIKPLFYYTQSKNLAFSSDIRSLIQLMNEIPRPNLQVAYDYLVNGDYDSTENTFIENISHLQPGHWLEFDLNKNNITTPQKWWSPDITTNLNISFEDASKKVRELFLKSVQYNLRSDVPIGAALSGGVDSSAVVCAMHYLDPQSIINTFSYIAKDEPVNEESWIDIINQKTGATPNKVYATADEMADDLDSMILMQGEPFGGTSIYAQYRVFKKVKECGVTVTLDGQGADELLAGYSGYPGYRLLSLIERKKYIKALKFSYYWGQWPGRSFSLAWKYFASLILPLPVYKFFRKKMGRDNKPQWLNIDFLQTHGVNLCFKREELAKKYKGNRVKEALARSLQARGLPSLLRHGDRNSMAFSIESRVPFLSLPLVNFLLSLPEEYLVSDSGETKHIFREAMRGIVPDSHLDRKDKIGFETPQDKWLQTILPKINQWITDSPDIPFINKNLILRTLKNETFHFDNTTWRWINYIRWYTLIFDSNHIKN